MGIIKPILLLSILVVIGGLSCNGLTNQQPDIHNYQDSLVNKGKIETLDIVIKEKIDFYIKTILLKDENGKILDKIDTQEPTIKEDVYENFETLPFDKILFDPRSGFINENKKTETTKRRAVIHLIGSQNELIEKEISLEGMQKKVKLTIQHDYSVNKLEISTDLDFDKWYLNGASKKSVPVFRNGGGLLKFGAGLPKGSYTIYLADKNGSKSKKYHITKDTKNGHVEVCLDLELSKLHWDGLPIKHTISGCEMSTTRYLLDKIQNLYKLFFNYKEDNSTNNLDAIVIACKKYNQDSNITAIEKDSLMLIPYIRKTYVLTKSINEAVINIGKAAPKKYLITIEKALKQCSANLSAYELDDRNHAQLEETMDYYFRKTQGKATTNMLIADIEKNFSKFAPK